MKEEKKSSDNKEEAKDKKAEKEPVDQFFGK